MTCLTQRVKIQLLKKFISKLVAKQEKPLTSGAFLASKVL